MPAMKNVQNRSNELAHEVRTKMADHQAGRITNAEFSAFMDRVEAEDAEIQTQMKTHRRALEYRGVSDDPYSAGSAHLAARGETVKWAPPSPLHAGEEQWKGLFASARNRMSSYSTHVGAATKGDASGWEIGLKSPTGEGSPGSLLPPILLPQAFQLRYEPDRIFEHFIGARAEGQSVSYLLHSGNTNPAAAVPELGTKPDLGMQITAQTVPFTKIAALCSFSREILDDFPSFMDFVPNELQRAVVDAETGQVINGNGTAPNMTGILHTSGVLTSTFTTGASDTEIDAIVESFNAIRVGSSFGQADLVAMHPTTWDKIRRTKNTLGDYILQQNDPNAIGGFANIFGVRVVSNTQVPVGTAITFDTKIACLAWTRLGMELMSNQFGDSEWNVNAWSFRAEERIAIGVQRPSAICVVTGL
jgi:HK97 family phage major capsid protein